MRRGVPADGGVELQRVVGLEHRHRHRRLERPPQRGEGRAQELHALARVALPHGEDAFERLQVARAAGIAVGLGEAGQLHTRQRVEPEVR